jgi:phage FluMu protein gp41
VVALRDRPALWETVALAALAILTIRTARSGVWLLFFVAAPAARALRFGPSRSVRLAAPALALSVAIAVVGLVRGPLSTGAGRPLLDQALQRAHGTPILADGVLAEQVALAGGRVWMSNPLDAFSRRDQRLYLDWLAGRSTGDAALRHARVVLVIRGGSAAKRLKGSRALRPSARDSNAVLYLRRP